MMIVTCVCFGLILCIQIVKAETTTYYVGPTGDTNAKDEDGYGLSSSSPYATVEHTASKLDGKGGTIILLDGLYHNIGYEDGNHWKVEDADTIRLNNVHGKEDSPIVIKGETPKGHVLRGDGSNIVIVRTSSHIVLENLNVEGDVKNISLTDAMNHRFDYKIEGDDTIYQRMCPELQPEHIEMINEYSNKKFLPNLKNKNVIRPTYYTTNGILIQSSRHILVKDSEVGYCPGTGLRFQSTDYTTATGNLIHNNSRRSSVGNHGFVIHSTTNKPTGTFTEIKNDNGYRIRIIGNTVRDNYNEVYSWSTKKRFLTPHIDEGKGITVQKTSEKYFNEGTGRGRILIANNIVFRNGFSGVHTNYATKVDIYHNTAIENTRSEGGNSGITVSDSSRCNVMNNIAYNAENDFGAKVYGTDSTNIQSDKIKFMYNLAVGNLSKQLEEKDFIMSTFDDLMLVSSPEYRISEGSSAQGRGDEKPLEHIPNDFYGDVRSDPPDLGASNVVASRRLVRDVIESLSYTPPPRSLIKKRKRKLGRYLSASDTCEDSTEFKCFCDFVADLARKDRLKICEDHLEDDENTIVGTVCPITCDSCPTPTSAPTTAAPTSCTDNPGKFKSNNGNKKTCKWVAKDIDERCKKENAKENCPVTCKLCGLEPSASPTPAPTRCSDNPKKFKSNNGNKKTCKWVAKDLDERCEKENAKENCPVTCKTLSDVCDEEQIDCVDNTDEFESNNGKMRTCEWIEKNTADRCDNLNVQENCPIICENPACV